MSNVSVIVILRHFNRPWSARLASEYHAFDNREVLLNSHRVFTLLFAVVLVGAGSAQDQGGGGQEPPVNAGVPRDAHWWTSLSGNTKNTFLDGYKAAMSHVNAKLFSGCVDEGKKIQARVIANPRAAIPPDDLTQSFNLCVLAGSFDFGFEQRELRNGVDEFYKDTQNSNVPIDVALQHVRDVLESKRPKNMSGIGSPSGKTHQ